MMTLLWVVLFLVILVVAAPFAAEALRQPITKTHEAKAPGQFADLEMGRTHFQWHGPSDGPVAVCIHGLSTPSYIFAATVQSLVSLGYNVLTYDLYGRGYSARVPGEQDAAFFLRQLRQLLAHQQVSDPVTLIGHSMGGAIAIAYAAEEGVEGVDAVILCVSAGVAPVQGVQDGWWSAPVVGDWLMRVVGGWALRKELVEHRTTATVIPDLEDRQAAETRMRGFLPALLSSRRNLLASPLEHSHKVVAASGIPTLAIWASDDPVIPLNTMARLAELNPHAHHEVVRDAGHNLIQTHPSQVTQALRAFLSG